MVYKGKKIVLKKNTKIYILAPAQTFTGGPECLHQLAYYVKKIFKVQTFIYYLPNEIKKPVHKNFKHYKIKSINSIEDNKDNILIMPEHFFFLKEGLNYSNIRKIIWWLSIDNYYGFKFRYQNTKIKRSLLKIPYNLISIFNKITNYYFGIFTYHDYLKILYKFSNLSKQIEIAQASSHLMQSYYAYDFLKKKLSNLHFLFDYQNKNILNSKTNKKKENFICYSNKCNEFINLLKPLYIDSLIELKGFTRKEMINIFKKTKIYIDFGYHPGKDKMPREAVLFNNCIITNKKGSAENSYDIPIKNQYKFKERRSNLNKIKYTIDKIFYNHKKEFKNFSNYKKIVLNEKKMFSKDLRKIFKKTK